MYVTLIIFLVSTLVSAEDFSAETKYIDLLPEKEKQEFLERIARRIFNGVRSKDDRESVSGEVSETQMNEHDEFVKKILEEESLNLRKSGDGLDNVKNYDVDSDLKKDEDNVKSDTLDKKDKDAFGGLVDLTLRDSKRNKRNSFEKTNNSKIINLSLSNGEKKLTYKKTDLSNVQLTQDKDELDGEDIQIKNFKRHQVKTSRKLETTTHRGSELQMTQMINVEAGAVLNKNDSGNSEHNANDNGDVGDNKKFRRRLADKTNEYETTTEIGSQSHMTQMTNFEADIKSKEVNFTNKKERQLDTFLSSNTHDNENNKYIANINEHIVDGNNNNDNVVNNHFDSTQKMYESLENNDAAKDSEENDAVTEPIKNTTVSDKSISPNDKPTLEPTTEKLLNENETTTEIHINNNPKVHYQRSYSESVTLKDNKKLVVKNITKTNTGDSTFVDKSPSVAAESEQNVESKTKSNPEIQALNTTNKIRVTPPGITNKEYTTETNVNISTYKTDLEAKVYSNPEIETVNLLRNLNSDDIITNKTIMSTLSTTNNTIEKNIHVDFTTFKTDIEPKINSNTETYAVNRLNEDNSDVIATNNIATSPTITDKENTTEKNTDIDSTTLKIEALTKSSLRTDAEVKVAEKTYLIKLADGKIINSKQFEKQVANDKIETNSKEMFGGKLFSHTHDETKVKNIGEVQKVVKLIHKDNLEQNDSLEKNTYNLENDMIKVLRAGIIKKPDSEEKNFKGLGAFYEHMKPKEYKVYEIPKSELRLMQKDEQDKVNKENPYYVPIYNYSPNNAYYNPHNRYGPNADDNDDENIVNGNIEDKIDDELDNNEKAELNLHDEIDGEDIAVNLKQSDRESLVSDELIRDSYRDDKELENFLRMYENYKSQRKFRFGKENSKSSKKKFNYKLNLPVVVQYPKFTDIILNPNDYSDINYARTHNVPTIKHRCNIQKKENNNIFPDSTEEDHPYNVMHDDSNLKDHLSSVRQLLYKNKQFGYSPSINETIKSVNGIDKTIKDILRIRPNENRKNHKSNDKNIAIDYFFGRMNEDSEMKTRTVEIIYNKDTRINRKENRHNQHRDKKLNMIPYKDKSYLYNDIAPATPQYTDVPKQYTQALFLRAKKSDKNKKNETDFDTIRKILSIADETDLVPTLDKLLKLNLTTKTRTGNDVDLEPYVMVLEDMVRNDAEGLKEYDWLQTTVDVQAALLKMNVMTEKSQIKIKLTQPDQQLLKYIIYLHKSVKKQDKDFRKNKLLLPRNKKKRKGSILKESGLWNRNWLIRMMEAASTDRTITKEDLNHFNEFLYDLQFCLHDFHTAIQQIAGITKYKNQRWFENLKELYIDNSRKNLLELLLHITTTRLLDLIEESAARGVEDDFLTFVMKNEKDVERTKDEFVMALNIIENLKKYW